MASRMAQINLNLADLPAVKDLIACGLVEQDGATYRVRDAS